MKISQFCSALEIDILLNVCSYIVDIIAVIALFCKNKELLKMYWLLRIMFSIYDLISVPDSFNMSSCSFLIVEIMLYTLVLISTLEEKTVLKEIARKIYYIPVAVYVIIVFSTVTGYSSGFSTIVKYILSAAAYFCMAYWTVWCSG